MFEIINCVDTDADYICAQHRLLQVANHLIQPAFAQIAHRVGSLSLPRENDAVGRGQHGSIIRHHRLHPDAVKGVDHRAYVTGVVSDYCYFHQLKCSFAGGEHQVAHIALHRHADSAGQRLE